MPLRRIIAVTALCAAALGAAGLARAANDDPYSQLQTRLAQGWNTWDTRSVLTQVHLPDGAWFTPEFTLDGEVLRAVQPGERNPNGAVVALGRHALDGSYTEWTLTWKGMSVKVETAADGDQDSMLITPLRGGEKATVRFRVGSGALGLPGRSGDDRGALELAEVRPLTGPVAWMWKRRPAASVFPLLVSDNVTRARNAFLRASAQPGLPTETSGAVASAIGWDTIYDAPHHRVLTPVSRAWNVNWGGWVLFDWDTFFAGYVAGYFNRDLAYANVIEMLRERAPAGFVPNYSSARIGRSLDRSEPPVGSLVVQRLYRRFHDRWFVEQTFPALLAWNRWWAAHRAVDGYLAWGTEPTGLDYDLQDVAVDTLQGAKYESGLDNSPMYDNAGYDSKAHRMEMADVGLLALYVADCDSLADLADGIGRTAEAKELRVRSAAFGAKLAALWDEKRGMYLNRDLARGAPSTRVSPTNFYPLLTQVPTPVQARRMIREHLFNPAEFWGEWVFPATPRNDPAFRDQFYWRGRIWGPMNQLVYWGLERYGTADERRQVAQKSEALLLKDWRERGQIHENYNAARGTGDDVTSSDPFYSWGALLGVLGWDEPNLQ
ncbi:MAG TPA: trehalase family glycosidase [Opitutaceae bacterium]